MKLFEELEDEVKFDDEDYSKESYCPFKFFLGSINITKENVLLDDSNGKIEEAYNPFIINKTLSYFPDTIMQSNTMNQFFDIDKKLQYEFLLNSIRKKKRFSRWIKSNIEENVDTVKQYYKVGNEKAVEILSLLNDEQISIIKSELSEGGVSGRRNNSTRIRGD
ncbi:MAG: DNA polymerase [Rickettsiales bacterium]|nr:DNA polymerase [Rickettsiales bacterium]|tara:strand:- start:16285 stop:16776 length:492 start_codon:yes stop_codon:yes gene_type:complete